MNRANWTVRDAIEERVRQEDLAEWGSRPRPVQDTAVMAKELPDTKWQPASLYVLGVNLRRLKGLLP